MLFRVELITEGNYSHSFDVHADDFAEALTACVAELKEKKLADKVTWLVVRDVPFFEGENT